MTSLDCWPVFLKRQAFAAEVLRQYPDCCPGILAIIKNDLSTSYLFGARNAK